MSFVQQMSIDFSDNAHNYNAWGGSATALFITSGFMVNETVQIP